MNNQHQLFKEVAQYLGAKLDTLASKSSAVKIDLGESSKLLDGAAKSLKETATALSGVKEISKLQADQVRSLSSVVSDLKDAVKSQVSAADFQASNTAVVGKITQLLSETKNCTTAIKNLKVEAPSTDLSPVVGSIEQLTTSIIDLEEQVAKNSPAQLESLVSKLIDATNSIKLNVPSTMKLDDMQVRKMSSGGLGGGGMRLATTALVANVALTATNTEYSYTFPANTVSFTMKMRDPAGKLYYSFTSGKMPAGGDSSLYGTVGNGEFRSQDGLELSRKTIYLGSDTASMVAELTVYTM